MYTEVIGFMYTEVIGFMYTKVIGFMYTEVKGFMYTEVIDLYTEVKGFMYTKVVYSTKQLIPLVRKHTIYVTYLDELVFLPGTVCVPQQIFHET